MKLLSISSLALLLLLPAVSFGGQAVPEASERERGDYLVRIMDCGGCHTPGALAGRARGSYLSGSSVGMGVPGEGGGAPAVFYPGNLTPDRATGLGAWSVEQIIAAIRYGQRPDGRMLSPVMPWPQYSRLTDADATAIVTFLRSLAPVEQPVPEWVPAGGDVRTPYVLLAPIEPK